MVSLHFADILTTDTTRRQTFVPMTSRAFAGAGGVAGAAQDATTHVDIASSNFVAVGEASFLSDPAVTTENLVAGCVYVVDNAVAIVVFFVASFGQG